MHFRVSHVSRSSGRSAVQAAAYITGEPLHDDRCQQDTFYGRSEGEIAWEALAPSQAPDAFKSLEGWNQLELFEDTWAEKFYKKPETIDNHKNRASIAMTIIAALPRELTLEQSQELVAEFVINSFISKNHYATYAIHNEEGNPHAHIMVSHRYFDEEGRISERKNRDLCTKAAIKAYRHHWATLTNQHLERQGHNQLISAASYLDLGIDLIPTQHEGWYAQNLEKQGVLSFIADSNQRIREENKTKILENPAIVLDYMTQTHATFTMPQLLKKIEEFFPGNEKAIGYVYQSLKDKMVLLGEDVSTETRFTSQEYQKVENQAVQTFDKLKDNCWGPEITGLDISKQVYALNEQLIKETGNPTAQLSAEQRKAIEGICRQDQISVLVGRAGAGKTTSMRVLKAIYEDKGYTVVGSALSASAAKNLSDDTGCFAETVRFYLHKWEKLDHAYLVLNAKGDAEKLWTAQDRKTALKDLHYYSKYDLTSNNVFIVDEASMIGMRDWQKILERIDQKGSKLVIVGDGRQFSAIDAGDMHRYMEDTIKAESRFVLSTINRQKVDFMRQASVEFSNQNIQTGLALYENHGYLKAVAKADTKDASYQALYTVVAKDYVERLQTQSKNGLVLAYSNDSCQGLNQRIRQELQARGLLSADVAKVLGIVLAEGDQVVFLNNHRLNEGVTFLETSGNKQRDVTNSHFIRNGTRGTVQSIERRERDIDGQKLPYHQLTIKLSDTLMVKVDSDCFKQGDISHGYALTTHKSQGQTVDWTLVVASQHMDSSAAYVALTRHRYDMKLYYSEHDFDGFGKLQHTLGRASYKDMALDYSISDVNRQYFNNVEGYRLITMEMADLIAHEDIYADEPKERMEMLEEERKTYGLAILADYDKYALYASQAKLTQQLIKITCGLEERPLSQAERMAKTRVLSYINLAQDCRHQWQTIVKGGIGDTVYTHPHYTPYEEAKQTRDALALEIYLNKALHRPFMREVGEALNYGFSVVEKQAKQALYRLDFKDRLPVMRQQMTEYKAYPIKLTTPDFWTTVAFQARGQAAMEIIATHLHEKDQNLPKLTLLYMKEQGLDFLKVRQDAFDYNRLLFARQLSDPTERRQAELVAAYDIAKRHAGDLYRQCATEIQEHNEKLKDENGKLSFWHAQPYKAYTEASSMVHHLAYYLSSFNTESTQALAHLYGVNLSKLEGHQHLGELHQLIQDFKAGTSIEDKALPAAKLVEWLAIDKEFRNDAKDLTGQMTPTYQVLQREAVNWSEVFNAAKYHAVSLNTESMSPSQIQLSDHVFAYSTLRREVGQAYAQAQEELKIRLTLDPTAKLWETTPWSEFLNRREVLNTHAAALYKAPTQDLKPFMEVFRLKEDVLERQSMRHEMSVAIQTVINKEADLIDRASAYLHIKTWQDDNLDSALQKIEKSHPETDLSSLKEYGAQDLRGLTYLFTKPDSLSSQGEKCLIELKAQDRAVYNQLMDNHQSQIEDRKSYNQTILEKANQMILKDPDKPQTLDKNLERLIKAQEEYKTALSKHPVTFDSFKNQQISLKDIENELKDKIVPLAHELFVGEKLHSKTNTQLRFGAKGSKCVIISGPKQGVYSDFETGEKGNAFKMIQDRLGLSFKEALKWSQSWLGNPTNQELWQSYKTTQQPQQKSIDEYRHVPIFPAPPEYVDIQNNKYLSAVLKDGQETMRHPYKDADNNILGYVVRIENQQTGNKATLPLTYCKDLKTGQTYWKWKGFGQDAPLYGLDHLAAKPPAPVLVVEGEKAADAARLHFPTYAVISWPSGSHAVFKADWTPLKGRDVVIWPDNDKAGFIAAHKVEKACQEIGTHTVSIVRVPQIFPAKWDLADAYPEGFTKADADKIISDTLNAALSQKIMRAELGPKIDQIMGLNPLYIESPNKRLKEEGLITYTAMITLCQEVGINLSNLEKDHLLKQSVYRAARAQEIRQTSQDPTTPLQTYASADKTALMEALYLQKTTDLQIVPSKLSSNFVIDYENGFEEAVEQISHHLKEIHPALPDPIRHGLAHDLVQVSNLCPPLKDHIEKVIEVKIAKLEPQLKEITDTAHKLEQAYPGTPTKQATAILIKEMQDHHSSQQALHKVSQIFIEDNKELHTQLKMQAQQNRRSNQLSL